MALGRGRYVTVVGFTSALVTVRLRRRAGSSHRLRRAGSRRRLSGSLASGGPRGASLASGGTRSAGLASGGTRSRVAAVIPRLVAVRAVDAVALIASVAGAGEGSRGVGACGVGLHTTDTKGAAVSRCCACLQNLQCCQTRGFWVQATRAIPIWSNVDAQSCCRNCLVLLESLHAHASGMVVHSKVRCR
jgi:hypothetical protein